MKNRAPVPSKEWLQKEFTDNQRSAFDIAKELGCFPTQVRRWIKKYGIEGRDRSEARKLHIEKFGHHMEGKTRSDEEKKAISMGLQANWEGMSEKEQKERRAKASKVAHSNWAALDEEQKKEMLAKMHKGNKKAAKGGSKNENTVAQMLKDAGYKVYQRTTEFTPACIYEIDIALPSLAIAIEIDGPTHWDPVYGEENLDRVQAKDAKKDDMLRGCGWTVVRCRDYSTSPSKAICRRIVEKIEEGIKNGTFADKRVHILDMK